MNLRKIISESINKVILDNIIREAIEEATTGQQQGGQQQQPQNGQQQQKASADYSQYANEIKKCVGNSGIDSSPVQNNKAAQDHIANFNEFLFNVLDAIYDGNITRTDAKNIAAYSPYRRSGSQMAMDASNNIVNYLGNNVDKAMGVIQDNPFNGVGGAFAKAHGQTNRDVAGIMNNMDRGYNRPGNKHSNIPLETLMFDNSSTNPPRFYNQLYQQYQQINQSNGGVLDTIPCVPQCYTTLRNLAQALRQNGVGGAAPQGQQGGNAGQNGGQQGQNGGQRQNGGQNNQQGQNGGNNGWQPPTPPPAQNPTNQGGYGYTSSGFDDAGHGAPGSGGNNNANTPPAKDQTGVNMNYRPSKIKFNNQETPNYANYSTKLKNIDENGEKFAGIVGRLDDLAANGDANTQNVATKCATLIKTIGRFSELVTDAIDNNCIYKKDSDRVGMASLTTLMSLDGSKTPSDYRYETIFWNYQKYCKKYSVLNEKPVSQTIWTLNDLHRKMQADGVTEKNKNNR